MWLVIEKNSTEYEEGWIDVLRFAMKRLALCIMGNVEVHDNVSALYKR